MNKKDKIEQEVQKTLELFDTASHLPPNPYFYTRVKARLEEKLRQRHVLAAILRPALLTIFLVINVSTAVWYLNASDQEVQSGSHQELVELLTNDFNTDNNQTDLFNIE